MKVLITGGAGFIGSHLAEKFLKNQDEVTVIDDLSTGSMDNIKRLEKDPRFHVVIESILSVPTLEPLMREADLVYHLAAAVGVKLIVGQPVATIETNIRGTEIALHLANKWRRPIVIASTSEVYGKSSADKFSEEDDMVLGPTTRSRWSYACSKAIDEFLAIAYHRKKNLPVIITRFFNTVGPRQVSEYGMVLPTFVRQALEEKDITVYGDGSQRRTFIDVSDVVSALTQLPQKENAFGQVFNLGGNQEISIFGLAEMVKARTKSASRIITLPYDEAYEPGFEDMGRRVPDISKISKMIGFEPKIALEEIVDRVIAHFSSH